MGYFNRERIKLKKNYFKTLVYVFLAVMFALFIFSSVSRVTVYEGRAYHTKKEVALYLYTYKKLPDNYITKSQAEDSGKQPYDGKYIGGDRFYYSGEIKKHTENENLRECDIDYPSNDDLRGVKRLVYASDCSEIFYTSNHYKSFDKITKSEINLASNVGWSFFFVGGVSGAVFLIWYSKRKGMNKEMVLADLKEVSGNSILALLTIIILPFYLIYQLISSCIKRIKTPR